MAHLNAVVPNQHARCHEDLSVAHLEGDPRWKLVQRIVAGPHFARSPLLCRFLLHVVVETLEGRGPDITERQIGVQVFDRPADYRTVEDNIVRNYARQIRKRLAEHFAREGAQEDMRVDIPVGGYVPVFSEPHCASYAAMNGNAPVTVSIHTRPVIPSAELVLNHTRRHIWIYWLLAAVYSVALFGIAWFAAKQFAVPPAPAEPAHALWAAFFGSQVNTYIVPSDAGFNLLEDISHRPMPLASYIEGDYLGTPLPGIDPHSAADLRSQQLTPFVDFQIMASIAHLPEENPRRVFIRFPRDLRIDDLKNSNAIIVGSVSSNPWAAIVESNANFRIVDSPAMKGATIVNLKPQPGEATSYESHWNEPAHETFALIDFLPNLTGTGHVLVLEGLDAAGTQAAAEMLFFPSAIDPILKRASRPDGSLHNFEVLLRSTSIESNAAGAQVVASRIY